MASGYGSGIMRSLRVASVGFLLGALALPTFAEAADIPLGEPVSPAVAAASREWTLTVGGYAMAQPEFFGSDDYEFAFKPIISISRADRLSRFTSFNDNASIALFDTGIFEAGIVGKLDWERDSSDSRALKGLDDVDFAFEVGGYAQWYPVDWLRLRGELRYGFGGFEGVVADLAADAIYRSDWWGGVTFSAGPRLTLTSSGFVDAYFGISDEEAFTSPNFYPPYDPGGGIYSVGVGGQILKDFGNGFRGSVFGEYRYLTGDAADSPIVIQNGDRNQFQTGVSLSYTFFLGFE
jgi:outer membrane protein